MHLPTEELTFHKSSYSQPQNCVEVARFRKSSYSSTDRDCVEVADLPTGAAVRDTQNREAGYLVFPAREWVSLLNSA
ncbi:DUF397 domain-containing protein [Nocardiopsis exhalans]|uniref:DUF397 domain-containing protein n=1 Tax=Nocardiopsis exhalans TaxID=163604 RepID=A0ABY5D5W0_9ACTN|nr:DUF397 domain-containing protein [Nocardiopsis exhalans]USY19387.1 DUF397 domain-containing protein [Nocardiopsis exhalans]